MGKQTKTYKSLTVVYHMLCWIKIRLSMRSIKTLVEYAAMMFFKVSDKLVPTDITRTKIFKKYRLGNSRITGFKKWNLGHYRCE